MRNQIAAIPVIDHHAHALMRLPQRLTPARFAAFFSEGGDAAIRREHVQNNLFFRRTLHDLARLLDCAATPEAVLAARAAMPLDEYARRLVQDANIDAFLLDYYFQSDDNYSVAEMAGLTGAAVYSVLRLETVLEELLAVHDSLDALLDAFARRIQEAAREGVVALKSIVAYRTGLRIGDPDRDQAEAHYLVLHEQAARQGGIRLTDKLFIDFCLRQALEWAGDLQLPVQFHTGFGDPDLDMREVNPLHMRPLLEDERYQKTQFVLLHASYPYVRELGYLASVYGHVYADVSLAIPFAVSDFTAIWREILALAPFSKILYASDGFSIPEHYWTGAHWARESLTHVLGELIDLGALDQEEAVEAARAILCENARNLYRLP